MAYYEVKIKMVFQSEEENTAKVQAAICEALSCSQRHHMLFACTKDDIAVNVHSWEPITDELPYTTRSALANLEE